MRRDPVSTWRLVVCFLICFFLAGVAEIIIQAISLGQLSWLRILKTATAVGFVGFTVIALSEKGFFYALIAAAGGAMVTGIFSNYIVSKIIQILLIFAFEILLVAIIFTVDRIAKPRRLFRLLLGLAGGLLASALAAGIAGSVIPSIPGFWQGIVKNFNLIGEFGAIPALALFFTRLLLGERKNIKPEEELE
ncbi:hypothetical protein JXM67_07900 [candidate division WOR-3 bacterium]|nr:hypothetical protein [candidate division WOR-3 bacterium]